MPQGATVGMGMIQNLLVFHHVSSSSVAFFFFLSTTPFVMCSGKGALWKPQNEIQKIFPHLRGSNILPVLQAPVPITEGKGITHVSKIKCGCVGSKGQRPS